MCCLCVMWIVVDIVLWCCFFFFKQKTAYEMRISDWSSDVCSSDLEVAEAEDGRAVGDNGDEIALGRIVIGGGRIGGDGADGDGDAGGVSEAQITLRRHRLRRDDLDLARTPFGMERKRFSFRKFDVAAFAHSRRSEEHTSELQS